MLVRSQFYTDPYILDGSEIGQCDRSEDGDENHMDLDTFDGIPGTSSRPPSESPLQNHAPQDGVPFIERFHLGVPRAPIPDMGQRVLSYQALQDDLGPENIWYLFQSQRDWDFARWAKNRGPSSTAVTELLTIDGVCIYLI